MRTGGIAKSSSGCKSGVTVNTKSTGIAGSTVADGTEDTSVIDWGVEVEAVLADISTDAELTVTDITGHARGHITVGVKGETSQALVADVVKHTGTTVSDGTGLSETGVVG